MTENYVFQERGNYMFKKTVKNKDSENLDIIHKLIDVGKADTVYRDLYLERARKMLSTALDYEGFHDLIKQKDRMTKLPNKINLAIDKGDWMTVKELSQQMDDLKKWTEEKQDLFDLGLEVYDVSNVSVNPFTHGFEHIPGIPSRDLQSLRDYLLEDLKELSKEDKPYSRFYMERRSVFESLSFYNPKEEGSALADLSDEALQENAQRALASGNMELLEEVSGEILKRKAADNNKRNRDIPEDEIPSKTNDRLFQFNDKNISKARRLGMIPAHVDRSDKYANLYLYASHHIFGAHPGDLWEKFKQDNPAYGEDVPDLLKKRVELNAIHTFINSGGTHHFPDFVAEDILVEDFQEGGNDSGSADSELISILGLEKRSGLSRKIIERALYKQGTEIVREELDLDPEIFRLVCIPSDLYLLLGESFEWGLQETWTHFDGYEILPKGKLHALAGGDARFGGVYDLVSIGLEYESERVITRFAVVQRKRMQDR